MKNPAIEVVAAVLVAKGRVLLAKREGGPLDGLWEFPGGKIEPEETWAKAVIRELHEELGFEVIPHHRVLVLEHEYPEKRVRLHFVHCSLAEHHAHVERMEGKPQVADENRSHHEIGWFEPAVFPLGDFCPADRIAVSHLDWKILTTV